MDNEFDVEAAATNATTTTTTTTTTTPNPNRASDGKDQLNEPQQTTPTPKTSDDLKKDGNDCMHRNQFAEAILHYSHAIKLMPNDPILYSNRSFAFLKKHQLYYANEDAERCIQLNPEWAKGYFRRAEVQAAAGQYDTALLSYGRALQLQSNDVSIINAARRVANLSNRATLLEKKIPWAGAAIGIFTGVAIVIADRTFTKTPTVTHPFLMLFLVMALSFVGYGIAKLYRYYSKLQQRGLLEQPVNLLDGFQSKESVPDNMDTTTASNRNRYSKAQARQRFKRGKT